MTRSFLLSCAGFLVLLAPLATSAQQPGAARPEVYFEFQVEKPAEPLRGDSVVYDEDDVTTKPSPRRGNRAPRYPHRLREQFVQGEVLTQFVITDEGKVAPGSFVVLRTSHPDFVPAVREAALGLRFNAAELNGRKVHTRVKMPFVFKLDRGSAPPTMRPRPGGE